MKKDKIQDYTNECGQFHCINGGKQCEKDNGITKYCEKCLCRVCIRGECRPARRTFLASGERK